MRKPFLIIALLLSLMGTIKASAQMQITIFFDGLADDANISYIQSVQVLQDRIYALVEGVLYSCDADTGEVKQLRDLTEVLPDPYLRAALTADGEGLFLLDTQEKLLYSVDANGDLNLVYTFAEAQAAKMREVVMPVLYGDQLFALNDNWGMHHWYEFIHVDLATGKAISVSIEGLQNISRYKDGLVLGFVKEMNQPGYLCTIDKAGEIVEVLAELPMATTSIAAYDEHTDTIYVYDGAHVASLGPDGDLILHQALNKLYARNLYYGGILDSKAYVIQNMNGGIIVSPIAEAREDTPVIHIAGAISDEKVLSRAMEEADGVALSWQKGAPFTLEEVAEKIRTGDDSIDIFGIADDMNLQALIARGFVQPIRSQQVEARIAQMHERARDYLTYEGEVYAVPNYVRLDLMGVNTQLLAGHGLTTPDTMDTYIHLYEVYQDLDRDEDAYFDWGMIFEESAQAYFLDMLLRQYFLTLEPEERPDFQDLRFAQPLARICAMDDEPLTWPSSLKSELYEKALLNTQYRFLEQEQSRIRYELDVMPLPKLEEGSQARVRADMGVYIINPCSKNIDHAVKVVERILKNLPLIESFILYPENDTPIAFPNYDEYVSDIVEGKKSALEALENEDGDNRGELEDYVAMISARLKHIDQYEHWLVKPEDIQRMRSVTPYMRFEKNRYEEIVMNTAENNPIKMIFKRLLAEELSMEQALIELNKKVEMIYNENVM